MLRYHAVDTICGTLEAEMLSQSSCSCRVKFLQLPGSSQESFSAALSHSLISSSLFLTPTPPFSHSRQPVLLPHIPKLCISWRDTDVVPVVLDV